ncbi:MAG: hypothetical protein GY913_12860 [Proteobacteria bacterium]|nr:hypothetical protein [Pseudomonadota bacterium]
MLLVTSALAATLEVPADYSTIQEALDAAEDGDEILVAGGGYSEDLTVGAEVEVRADGDVEIIGRHLLESPSSFEGIDFTGNGSDPCFRIDTDELTVADASVVGCAGAFTSSAGVTLVLHAVELSGNASPDGAGAIQLDGGDLVMTDSSVRGNSTTYGQTGGIEVNGDVVIESSVLSDNQGYSGPGALQVSGSLVLQDTVVDGNSTTYGTSGGVAVVGGTVEISGSEFSDNAGYNGGGALYVQGGDLVVESTTFEGSSTTYNAGGAIAWLDGDFLMMSDVRATGGSAQNGGGLLYARGGSISLVRVWLEEGQTTYGDGGVASLTGNSVEVTNSVFRAGTAQGTGVLAVSGQSASLVNNDFLDGSSQYGASLLSLGSAYTEFVNNIGAFGPDTPVSVGGTVEASHNAWFELDAIELEGPDDVLADCEFVAYPDDLHLAEGSPCIDAGTPDLLDADGSPSDIGAFGGPDSEAPESEDTGDTGDTGVPLDTDPDGGVDDTGLDGDVKLQGSGVRGFCGCRSGNALILLGFLMLFRRRDRFTRSSSPGRTADI